jgi:hypothetical protein
MRNSTVVDYATKEAEMVSENRVNPWGRVFATAERGYFMGNRSDPKAWITCSLRDPDGAAASEPVRYQKLFFLDEATALAAGHRPCGQCRTRDYRAFVDFWKVGADTPMDATLRKEMAEQAAGRFQSIRAERLPAGTMFEVEGEAYLAWQRLAFHWSSAGYSVAGLLKERGKVKVLTPPSTVAVLERGYRPWVHPSVLRAA